jgi:hypothetical protein
VLDSAINDTIAKEEVEEIFIVFQFFASDRDDNSAFRTKEGQRQN